MLFYPCPRAICFGLHCRDSLTSWTQLRLSEHALSESPFIAVRESTKCLSVKGFSTKRHGTKVGPKQVYFEQSLLWSMERLTHPTNVSKIKFFDIGQMGRYSQVLWTSCKLPMNFLLTFNELGLNFFQTFYRLLTSFLQISYKLPVISLQTSYELLTDFYEFFEFALYKLLTDFLWSSHRVLTYFL